MLVLEALAGILGRGGHNRDLAEAALEAAAAHLLGEVLLRDDHGLEPGLGADLLLLTLEEADGRLLTAIRAKKNSKQYIMVKVKGKG